MLKDGNSAVASTATFLSNAGVNVDRILHSGKSRAKQTAEILAKSVSESGLIEAISGINPNDAVDEFIPSIEHINTPTMIVGHLPFMAKLVSQLLLGQDEKAIVEYQPGSVVCLGKDDNNDWVIHWMIRPALLK